MTPSTGDAVRTDQGKYVENDEEELRAIQIESTHTVDIDGFLPRTDIDNRYLDKPYYSTPNGKTAIEAFVVIRDAMQDEERVALAQIVMSHREHVIMLTAPNEPEQTSVQKPTPQGGLGGPRSHVVESFPFVLRRIDESGARYLTSQG